MYDALHSIYDFSNLSPTFLLNPNWLSLLHTGIGLEARRDMLCVIRLRLIFISPEFWLPTKLPSSEYFKGVFRRERLLTTEGAFESGSQRMKAVLK